MPTVSPHHYKMGLAAVVVALLGYAIYYLYSNSTGTLLARARQELTVSDFSSARQYLDRILAKYPDHVDALLLKSGLTLREGDYPGTEASLKRILSQEPTNTQAHSMLAQAYLAQCRFEQTLEQIGLIGDPGGLPIQEKGKKALAMAGLVLGGSDTAQISADAEKLTSEILKENPDQPEAHLAKSILLMEQGNGADARPDAEQARQRMGSTFLAECTLGKACFLGNDIGAAATALDSADERRKNRRDLSPPPAWTMELYLYRGLCHIEQGNFEEAERSLAVARENQPSAIPPSLALINLYLIRAVEHEMVQDQDQRYLRYYQRAADELARQPNLLATNPVYAYQLGLIQIYLKDYKNALKTLEALADRDPPYLQALHELGNQYNYQASYSKAIRTYQRVLTYETSNLIASYNLGTIIIRNRDIAGAREQLQSVVNREPDWLQARLNLGLCCRLSEDYRKAEESYQFILAKTPNDVDALIGLGLVASAQGDTTQAQKYFAQARDLHPERSEPYYYLAQAALEEGKAGEAQSMFEKCLSLDPENEFASMSLVEINLKKGAWEQARTQVDVILANPNARMRTITENALCLVQIMAGNLDDAKSRARLLQDLLGDVSMDIRGAIHNNLAILAHAEKRQEDAIQAAKKVVDALPKSADAYYNLGTLQLNAGNYPEAILAFRRALEFDPKHPSVQYNLAVAEATLNRWDAALKTLSALVQNADSSAEMLGNLAEAYLGSGKPEEALKILDPAINRFPLAVELQTLKAKAMLVMGDKPGAGTYSTEIVNKFPQDGSAQMVRGVAAYHMGEFAECETRLRKALQILGKDPTTELNLATYLIDHGGYETLTEADSLLSEAEKAGMPPVPLYNQRALLAFRRADYTMSKKFLELSLAEDSNQAEMQDLLRRIEEM